MNNGPEDVGDEREPVVGGEIAEAAMEALLRAEFREPLALPGGFKERLLARAAATDASGVHEVGLPAGGVDLRQGKAKVPAFSKAAVWRMVAGGALAASLLAGAFGVELERGHREAGRMAQERVVANQQFEEASRITDAALQHTRQQLQRAGVFEDAGR